MTKLKRQPDGSYRGTYKGHEFTVRKEEKAVHPAIPQGPTEELWVARAGAIVKEGWKNGSRADVVKSLQRAMDEAAVNVPPEIDAILKRWAEEIQAILPRLNPHDPYAAISLQRLKDDLEHFERDFRRSAVSFEEALAKLKARMQQAPEVMALATSNEVRP